MAILADISDRKQSEEKLRQFSSELEGRVQERTAALEEANEALTAQIGERLRMENELRDQAQSLAAINNELESFSFSVSHDLRAPLRQISGYSHLLLEESGEVLSTQARSDLSRIMRGVEFNAGIGRRAPAAIQIIERGVTCVKNGSGGFCP